MNFEFSRLKFLHLLLQEERNRGHEAAASSVASTASKSDSNSDKKSLQDPQDMVQVHKIPLNPDFSYQVISVPKKAQKCHKY